MRNNMKYLKIFESTNQSLQDFCETNLAYLLDDMMTINYTYLNDVNYNSSISGQPVKHKTVIYRIKLTSVAPSIRWNDIKDHVIPFLERLVSKNSPVIKLHSWAGAWGTNDDIVRSFYNNQYKFHTYYDIINDRIDLPRLTELTLKVEY